MKDYKKYLPSKKFRSIILLLLIILLFIVSINGLIKLLKNKKIIKDKQPAVVVTTVANLTQKDSNDNGIPDWEEYLWGLNPNKNGENNKEIIEGKKKLLTKNGIIAIDDSKNITENELLTRQFFATLVSLQETGQVDQGSINSLSEAIGQQVQAVDINDIYTKDMLNIIVDSDNSDIAYYALFNSLVVKYEDKDLGSELTLIAQGIANKDAQSLYAAKTIADSYRNFGKELIKISVPSSAALTHLRLVNDYEKVAKSIEGLSNVLADPIIGMKYILSYKKYSESLYKDLESLSNILQ